MIKLRWEGASQPSGCKENFTGYPRRVKVRNEGQDYKGGFQGGL